MRLTQIAINQKINAVSGQHSISPNQIYIAVWLKVRLHGVNIHIIIYAQIPHENTCKRKMV